MPKRKRTYVPRVPTFVSAVRRGDVEWVKKHRNRKEPRVDDSVSEAYRTNHPPGMLAALCNAGFYVAYPNDEGKMAGPSHACHGVPFPDHVLTEHHRMYGYGDVSHGCPLRPFYCALQRRDYALARRVWNEDELPYMVAASACRAGRCEVFQREFMVPFLESTSTIYRPGLSDAVCLHGVASYERICQLLGPPQSSNMMYWVTAAHVFLGLYDGTPPEVSTEEQTEFLFRLYEGGVGLEYVWHHKLERCFQPDTGKMCVKRFRAPIVDAVAVHLPVVGVPELVASFVSHPFRALFSVP